MQTARARGTGGVSQGKERFKERGDLVGARVSRITTVCAQGVISFYEGRRAWRPDRRVRVETEWLGKLAHRVSKKSPIDTRMDTSNCTCVITRLKTYEWDTGETREAERKALVPKTV